MKNFENSGSKKTIRIRVVYYSNYSRVLAATLLMASI